MEIRTGRREARAPGGRTSTVALLALAGGSILWWATRSGTRPGKRRPDIPALAGGRGLHVTRAVTIGRPADEVYRTWRDLAALPRYLPAVESVTPLPAGRSRWVARGPGSVPATWEAELTADQPGRLIAWRSVPGSQVDTAGSVEFSHAPGERGTEVKVVLNYSPPGGKAGGALAFLFGRGGDRQLREGLRRLKRTLEAGEAPTTEGQPSGRPAAAPAAYPRSA